MEEQKGVTCTSVELYAVVTSFVMCFSVSLQAYSMTFLAPSMEFECVQWSDESLRYANRSNCDGRCQKWEYNHSEFDYTLTEKLDLVCDKSWLISLGNALNMAGDTVGCFIFGYLADRFGRKPVVFSCSIFAVFSQIFTLFLLDFNMFISGRFLSGFASYGLMNTTYVLVCESLQVKNRTLFSLLGQSGWTWGLMFLSLVTYLNRDWYYTQLAITIVAAILPVLIWFLAESPRWLMENKKLANENTKVNDKQQICEPTNHKADTEKYEHRSGILDLFRTPSIRRRSLVMFMYWLTIGFTYFGISLNAGLFGKNVFLNFFLNSIVEFPSLILTIYLDRVTGRKVCSSVFMVGGGISLILVIFTGENWLLTTFVVLGKLFISSAFYLAYIYTTELFPTVIRGVGLGSSNMFCRIGSIVAPFVKELSEAVGLWVPMALFGILCLVSGMLVVFLPETRGIVLLDSIEEAENADSSGNFSTKGKLDLTVVHRNGPTNQVTLNGIKVPNEH